MKPTVKAATVAVFGLMALLAISSSSAHRQSQARLQALAKAGNAVETVPKTQLPADAAFRAEEELAAKGEEKPTAKAQAKAVDVEAGAHVGADGAVASTEPVTAEPAAAAGSAEHPRIDVYVHVNVHKDETAAKAAAQSKAAVPVVEEKPAAEEAKVEEKPAAEAEKTPVVKAEKPAAEGAKVEEKPAAEEAKVEEKPAAEAEKTKLAAAKAEVAARGASFGTFLAVIAMTGVAVLAVVQARKQGHLPEAMEEQMDSLLGSSKSAYSRV